MSVARDDAPEHSWASFVFRGALVIFLIALGLRLLMGVLIADTYDYDEFVLLLLARDFAHGDVPYRDFMFFHPPGALVLLRGIEPVTSFWWPIARLATSAVDSVSAALVFVVGARAFGRRAGFAAGLVYAASPLALVTAVRIGQDPLVTCLGMLGITLALLSPHRRWSVAAGVCLGVGVWIKYPELYFMPVIFLVSPRRFPFVVLGAIGTLSALVAPFDGQIHALYAQTIAFQHNRWSMALDMRIITTAIFWLMLNAAALPALSRRVPAWLVVGFVLGGFFVFTPQVYYHYFEPVVPFAALLSGLTITRFARWTRFRTAAALLLCVLLPAALIDWGGHSPLYVTAARLSEVAPTVRLLENATARGKPVLADRYEYAYLANRPALAHYFWNVGVLVNARYLETRVPASSAVVLSSGASSGYPSGFIRYLDRRYRHVRRPTADVWLLPRIATKQ